TGGSLKMTGHPFAPPGSATQSYIIVDGGVTATIASSITGNAVGIGLDKEGAGTLLLGGANTYDGPTNINGGTLALVGAGSITASSQVNVANAAATFDISGTAAGATITTLNGVAGSHVALGGQ